MTVTMYDYNCLRVTAYLGHTHLTASKSIQNPWDQKQWRNTWTYFGHWLVLTIPVDSEGLLMCDQLHYISYQITFQWYMDHRKWTPDVSVWPVLWQTNPGGRGRLKFMLDWASDFRWTSLPVIFAFIASFNFLMSLSNVLKKYNVSSPFNLIGAFEVESLDLAYWLKDQQVHSKEWCPHQPSRSLTLEFWCYSTPQVKIEQKKYWAIPNNVQYHPVVHQEPRNTETQVLNNTEFCSV
jgi:hypothetical protein